MNEQEKYDDIRRRIKKLSDDSENIAKSSVYTSAAITFSATLILAPNIDGLLKAHPLNIAAFIVIFSLSILLIREQAKSAENHIGNNLIDIIDLQSQLEKLLQNS